MRSRVKKQKEYVDGFSHREILSEVSAPLEIVSRLLDTKFVIAITPDGPCARFMQHFNLRISEVPDFL